MDNQVLISIILRTGCGPSRRTKSPSPTGPKAEDCKVKSVLTDFREENDVDPGESRD